MMSAKSILVLTLLLHHQGQAFRRETSYDDDPPPHRRCEKITIALCQNIRYNTTIFPNILGQQTQEEAGLVAHQFFPLVKLNCARHLQLFLCSVYFPVCTNLKEVILPCKHLCEHARTGCESLMNSFKFAWPVGLNCDELPEKEKGDLCFSSDDEIILPPVATVGPTECATNKGFVCPSAMVVAGDPAQGTTYSFLGVESCAAPCDKENIMFWEFYQQELAHWWIGCWSILCAVSTLFTVSTYLIDMSRFRYPERPIVFLSGCYMMVSIAYITGFFVNDGISCKQFLSEECRTMATYEDCHKVVIQGTKEAGCTILFMLLYFFGMASSIWWVILTVTWFLAAGLKWGNEAIEAISHYFHLLAWAIPAINTIIILAMARVEGDVLSGVCFVGVNDTDALLWFILIPLVTFLCVGTGFLIAGFIALFHIRTVVKNEGGAKVEKLERLMVRIGVFSVLYTVPATVTIACYFYEHINRESWQKGWVDRNCNRLGIPCPCEYQEYRESHPDFTVFIIKYFMMLIVGITSGFWIWSSKTFETWRKFRMRVCCCVTSRRQSNSNGLIAHAQPTQYAQGNLGGTRPIYIRGHAN